MTNSLEGMIGTLSKASNSFVTAAGPKSFSQKAYMVKTIYGSNGTSVDPQKLISTTKLRYHSISMGQLFCVRAWARSTSTLITRPRRPTQLFCGYFLLGILSSR